MHFARVSTSRTIRSYARQQTAEASGVGRNRFVLSGRTTLLLLSIIPNIQMRRRNVSIVMASNALSLASEGRKRK